MPLALVEYGYPRFRLRHFFPIVPLLRCRLHCGLALIGAKKRHRRPWKHLDDGHVHGGREVTYAVFVLLP